MLDIHEKQCNCSYCSGDNKMHYGLNIPTAWRYWNSWWVVKFGPRHYFRWTNTFIKYLK